MTRSARRYLSALLVAVFPVLADAHPLDPLTAEEIGRAVAVIAESGHVDASTRAAIVTLKEPNKSALLGQSYAPVPREAFAVLRHNGEAYEAVVDLAQGALTSWTRMPGVQPAIQSAEWSVAQDIVKADPRWQAAMRLRGYTAFDNIFCESLSAGYFAVPEEAGRRLLKMPCYDVAGARTNVYARPIEGLVATVDLDAGRVIELLDAGVVPVGRSGHEIDAGSDEGLDAGLRPIRTTAADGWNFTLNGRVVSWQGWSFHLGFDQRFGPIISLVTIEDDERQRLVLYQGHVSEVFVPYMDPTPSWAFRTYLDAGEFGLGALASPLTPGADCPENAIFLDATLVNFLGYAYQRDRVVCVFERDPGAPLWRHHEALTGVAVSQPATELVVRSIPSVAHYDYVIDWVFTQGGAIQVKIGATGIDSVKGVEPGGGHDWPARVTERHGAEVASGLLAINHDHYFSLRLDLDIDGSDNRFVREHLQSVMLPTENFRRSLWQAVPETMMTEAALSTGDAPEVWRVENPNVLTELGQHPGYQIETDAPPSLLAPEDWPQRRAGFSSADLWITRRNSGELYAAGAYPNQSKGGDGLPSYVNGEDIESGDLVAWSTIGFRHVTRPEDWPVLTTVWQGITLRPYGFFTRNPALAVRRNAIAPPP